jgi:archaellum component FlaC
MYQGSDIMSQLGIFSLNEFIKLRDSTVNCQKEIQEAVEELERLTQ